MLKVTKKLKIMQRRQILTKYHITIIKVIIREFKSVNGQSTLGAIAYLVYILIACNH